MTIAMLTILTPLARADDNNQVGRYQLVAADVDHSGTQTVFKIDTVTGQAWTYTEAEIIQDQIKLSVNSSISERFWSSINEQAPTGGYRTIVGR